MKLCGLGFGEQDTGSIAKESAGFDSECSLQKHFSGSSVAFERVSVRLTKKLTISIPSIRVKNGLFIMRVTVHMRVR